MSAAVGGLVRPEVRKDEVEAAKDRRMPLKGTARWARAALKVG